MSRDSLMNHSLHDYLSNNFSQFPKLFNCVHINAQSLANDDHYSNFLATFSDCAVSAILVSETWLKPSIPKARVKLAGYNCIRHDRKYSGGGGVAIYLRDSIKYNVLKTSDANHAGVEYILIEAWCSGSKFLLGVFYRPPTISFLDEFETLLMNYLPHFCDVILMGDFNCNLLRSDSPITAFKDVVSSVNLCILPTTATYHIPSCSSLLDLMLVVVPRKVKHFNNVGAPGFSNHDLVHLSYDMRCPKSQHKILQYRDYRNLNVELLVSEARQLDWGAIRRCDCVEEKVSILTNIITSLYEKHVPLKTSRVRRPPAPWVTEEIKCVMKSRDRAHAKFRNIKSRENWDKYRRLRNKSNRLVRDSRRRDIAQNVEDGQSANTWQYLKSLGVTDDGEVVSSNSVAPDVNVLNSFFVRPPITLDPDIKLASLNSIDSEASPHCEQFTFSQVTEAQVSEALKGIKSNAVGTDQVVLKFVNLFSSHVIASLTHIFNFSLSKNIFPAFWKESIVVPLPKISDAKNPTDFRPISILPVFSKVFERVVHCQVSHFLSTNHLLSPFQSGFRAEHSTTTALLKVTEDARLAMDRKMVTILLLLDFSKAFDTVDHDILLARLSTSYNFSQSAVSWFRSYLSNRKQYVRDRNCSSDFLDVIAGVPQGSVLGPLLFSLFVNPITEIFRHCFFHMYADDLQLYIHTTLDDFSAKMDLMNEDLGSLLAWTKSFGILPNPNKFQAIVIGSGSFLSRLDLANMNLVFNQTPIPFSNSVKI